MRARTSAQTYMRTRKYTTHRGAMHIYTTYMHMCVANIQHMHAPMHAQTRVNTHMQNQLHAYMFVYNNGRIREINIYIYKEKERD